jgi:transcriptional regulator with XRE-family HTH domain
MVNNNKNVVIHGILRCDGQAAGRHTLEKINGRTGENPAFSGQMSTMPQLVGFDEKTASLGFETRSVGEDAPRNQADPSSIDTTSVRSKSKSVLRMRYEAEVSVIRRKLGDLEQIRNQLGLSQRKMCQLLLVDPSAWTRWTRGGEDAPPHIYRTLQWYLALEDKYPALDATFWLSAVAKVREPDETAELKKEISVLKEESLLNAQRGSRTNAELMQNFETRMQLAERQAQLRLWWILAFALIGSLIAGIVSSFAFR